MNSWTLLMSSNVVNPGKISHSKSIGSPSIVSKVLYCGESLNQLDCSSETVFHAGFRFTFPRHDTESENTWTFACERLMTSSSLTKGKCFHEESSQFFWSHSQNLICLSDYQLFRYVKHLFQREIVPCIFDGM